MRYILTLMSGDYPKKMKKVERRFLEETYSLAHDMIDRYDSYVTVDDCDSYGDELCLAIVWDKGVVTNKNEIRVWTARCGG